MSNKIKVVVCEPGKSPEVKEIDNSLASMQQIVGGYIECLSLAKGVDLWMNEEGRLMNLPYNRSVNGFSLVGNVFVAGSNKDGETVSLTASQIKKVLKLLG